jgi:glycosyltransferase involved in cell wall biosynthesis
MKRMSAVAMAARSQRQSPAPDQSAAEIDPMRIALVAFHHAEYACRFALALAHDHKVLLLLNSENASGDLLPKLQQEVNAAVEVHVIVPRKLRDPLIALTAAHVVQLINRFRPDVLHVQETATDLGFWPIIWLARNTPLVLTVHDAVAHSGADAEGLRRSRRKFYMRSLRERADRLIVHGERIRNQVLNLTGWAPDRVCSVMHGALGDAAGLTVSEPSGATLLFFGRIEAYKGLGILLDALDLLRDVPFALRLVIAGQGSDLQRFRARIAADPRIELIDRFIDAEEVPGLFLRSTIVVLPYLDASQSGVAAIAVSYRRPVIASEVGGLPDVIRQGESGILVPAADPEALAAAIRQVCGDPALLRRMSIGAEALAKGELSWQSISRAATEVYRGACAAVLRRNRHS